MCLSNTHSRSPICSSRAFAKPASPPPHFPHILRLAPATFASTVQHQRESLSRVRGVTQAVRRVFFSPRSQVQGFMGMC